MIYLIHMPFAFLTYPNLALSTMKSQMRAAGLDAKVLNLNISLAQKIGFRQYTGISFMKGIDPRMSEWLFAEQAWGESFAPGEEDFLNLCVQHLRSGQIIRDNQDMLLRMRNEIVPDWLNETLDRLELNGRGHAVGFSCSFFQTLPSIALARRIKEQYPHVRIIFGGAGCRGEMGREIFSKTPWIDAVCLGEADDVVVKLFGTDSENWDPAGLQGIMWRDEHGNIRNGAKLRSVPKEILDQLPVPDFDDFFADADASGLSRDHQWAKRAFLPFESARGCWKARTEPCRFCGAIPDDFSYRAKSADNLLQTLDAYIERYPLRRFHATDTNLAPGFFRTLLPGLGPKMKKHGVSLFYEVTSGLDRSRVKALADAGIIYVQAGIESLNTRLLELMNKGVSAIENVFFLKCCAEYRVLPLWNFLVRVSGERREDYGAMEKLIPLIFHLRPPVYKPSPIQCHRFSPYFKNPGKWAENIRPQPWYSGLFPSDRIRLDRVAYYFDADWKHVLSPLDYTTLEQKTMEWIGRWTPGRARPQLSMHRENGQGLKIHDTRGIEAKTWRLDAHKAMTYKKIADPTSMSDMPDPQAIAPILDEFVHNGLAIEENGVYLALAI